MPIFVVHEMEVVLVIMTRELDFATAYDDDEWNAEHPKKGLHAFRGDPAYQIEAGPAHPLEKHSCRVSVSKM